MSDEERALSGVRIATSTRGFDVAVHAYVACTAEQLRMAGDLAMDEYVRVLEGMKERLNQSGVDAFAKELARRQAS